MESKTITIPILRGMKQSQEKIVALTAYDFLLASLLDQAGIDVILVGDSGAMVFSGQETTLPMTMEESIYHCKAVRRGVRHALLVADMPFLSYQVRPSQAVQNAGRFFKEAEVDAVKIEGGAAAVRAVEHIIEAGMPVMGHLGLTPQSIRKFGGYEIQGHKDDDAKRMIEDALALEEAGVFAIVLEKIPHLLARTISEKLTIPTIGIGAGPYCDGQILVTHDMLGLFEKFRPRFVRRYAELADLIKQACSRYADDTRKGKFPNIEESY
jgi:3-methyl-2-oxobutanoate hydroxymethyltransferase